MKRVTRHFILAVSILAFSASAALAVSPLFLQVEGRAGHFDEAELRDSSDFPSSGEINVKVGTTLNSGDTFGAGYSGLSTVIQIPGSEFFTANNIFGFYQIKTDMGGDSSFGFNIELGIGNATRDPSIAALPPGTDPLPTSEKSLYYSGTLFWEKPVTEQGAVVIGGGYRQARFSEVKADFTGFVALLGIKVGG
jgi:hypothetical protein